MAVESTDCGGKGTPVEPPGYAVNSPSPIIVAENVAAGKGGRWAFRDLSFEIAPASFIALVGPNGSGKTTLFETLLGLVSPGAGSITVFGGAAATARSQMAYVPQTSRLVHDGQFAGREFVASAYNAQCWGIPWRWKAAKQAVDRALAQVDAQGLAAQKLACLSGGQRQRLLIAQALVNRPRLLLLDEPLSQLDPAAQEQVVAVVEKLNRKDGITVIVSTHDVNALVGVADSVLYLAGGCGRMGAIREVITDEVLSQLYGVPMHVVSEQGRVFVTRGHGRESVASDRFAAFPSRLRSA